MQLIDIVIDASMKKGEKDNMDRMAVLLNLRDLRDLEVAKSCVMRMRNEDWYYYQQDINNLSAVKYIEMKSEENVKEDYILGIACAIIGGIITCISMSHLGSGEGWPPILNIIVAIFKSPTLALLGMIVGVPVLVFGFYIIKGTLDRSEKLEETKEYNENARKHNAEEKARFTKNKPQIKQLKQYQMECDEFWDEELKKIDDLLDESYSVNLVPKIYRRKLAAIQYIYEYMSSSQVSLEYALLSTQIEEGIRRIEEKLDIIIGKLEELVFELHRQEAQNASMMEQNNRMIESLRRTEENTLEASRYAQINACYNKTCAFFALANYLDK